MAKAKKAKAKEEKDVFVGIKSPKEVRKAMLEALRDLIELLQKSERIKKVRAERYEAVAELRANMNEVAINLTKLEQMLPKYTFEKPKIEGVEREKKIEKRPRAKEEEIELLERGLAEVEAKLRLL